MANITVTVEPQAQTVVKFSKPAVAVSVVEDRVGPVEIVDPNLVVSLIEGFMTIFRLGDLIDVDLSDLEDGSVLVYHADVSKWVAQRTLEQQYINAGQF